jgi:phosphatidylglycerol:prolipoprotein diacylglycerol transferase
MNLQIDPVLLYIAGYPVIRWYSVSYILGFLCAYLLFKKYGKFANAEQTEAIFNYGFFGVIIGGRVGYCLFYNLGYCIQHPLDILKIWQGGMSFHGGLLGVIIGLIICCKKHKIDIRNIMDIAPLFTTPGLFFGRIANFINGELWGSETTLPIGFIFPQSGTFEPRHPTQLYEALTEGLLIFIVMFILYRKKQDWSGKLFGLFLVMYGLFRFLIEFVRQPDAHIGYIFLNIFTMGHLLCFTMILAGLGIIFWKRKAI